MKKVFGVFLIALGVFAIGGVASASTADILQPAGATTNMESLRVGIAGQGGVTFFNGSIVNESGPLVMADDMRVDGEIWRGPSKGTSDGQPLKISDTVVPTLTGLNDLGTSSQRWKGIYGEMGNFSGSVVSNGRVLGQTLAEAISEGDSVAGAPGELTASTWTGSRWMMTNSLNKDVAASITETSGISVTFSPTSLTEGTFTSTESFARANDECQGGLLCNWGAVDHSTRTGSYRIIGNNMFLTGVLPLPETWTTPSPPHDPFTQTGGLGHGHMNIVIEGDVTGDKMTSGTMTLTRQ